MSKRLSPSAGLRLFASEVKATRVPSPEIDASRLSLLPLTPLMEVEASVTLPSVRLFTNMSLLLSLSRGVRLEAEDQNATLVPSSVSFGSKLPPFPFCPAPETDASVNAPGWADPCVAARASAGRRRKSAATGAIHLRTVMKLRNIIDLPRQCPGIIGDRWPKSLANAIFFARDVDPWRSARPPLNCDHWQP